MHQPSSAKGCNEPAGPRVKNRPPASWGKGRGSWSGAANPNASGQFPAATGAAQADPGLDADAAAGEADQDWGQGGRPRQVRHLSVGGSRRAAAAVRPDSGADQPTAFGLCLGASGAAAANPVRTFRRASVVHRWGGIRGLSVGNATGGAGSRCEKLAIVGVFCETIVVTVPPRG